MKEQVRAKMNGQGKHMVHERAEVAAVNRIRCLYEEMIHLTPSDENYAEKLAKELTALQQDDGTWRVIPAMTFPMDIHVDYILMPTYYATAALMAYMNIKACRIEKAEDFSKHYSNTLRAGLQTAMERQLKGSGFEATSQQLEALNIYKDAGLYGWLAANQEDYPEFAAMIKGIIREYRRALETGHTYSDWNVDFSSAFKQEIEDYESGMTAYVWYAAYGSNISRERFMRYISRCTDKTAPVEDRRFILPYSIYFGDRSNNWGDKGVAFLDDSRPGQAPGRIYRIKKSQFTDIQRMEGVKYSKKVGLGVIEDVPVYTFTSDARREKNAPSADYFNVILRGLAETYPEKSENVLKMYLFMHGALRTEDRQILAYIRNSEHGVSLREMEKAEELPGITKIRYSVKKMAGYGLLKQDGRSVRAGERLASREAVIYTKKEMREMIEVLLWQ